MLFTSLVNRPDGLSASPLPPATTALAQNRPNPFNPRTSIRFTLATAGPIELGVYDLEGRLVRRLESGNFAACTHDATWQGDDDHGAAAASGTYFCRLRAEGQDLTRKMTLLR